ncbi:MAG: TetR/AcrR family transcriptional regulator [Phototrophicaceae bacterium]
MTSKNAKVQQGEATVTQLMDIAQTMFSELGYTNVAMEAIVKQANVTRGALYHHFNGKKGLFEAVVHRILDRNSDAILATGVYEADQWQQLLLGCESSLRSGIDPAIRRILLIDAPAVLGHKKLRQMDANTTTALLINHLTILMDNGYIEQQPVQALAYMISGAINEAIQWISASDNPEDMLEDYLSVLENILNGLRIPRSTE